MDPNAHQHTMAPPPIPSASSSRKRSRENETPSQRHKREKAAERQRRKRERDRQAGLNNILSLAQQVQQQQQQQQQPLPIPQPQGIAPIDTTNAPPVATVSAPPELITGYDNKPPPGEELSQEEIHRRERVRAAARERQRKHRALVKQKKLRELGLDMGNEIIPEVHFRMNADGQYQEVMAHEMQGPPPPHPHPHQVPPHSLHEPPFPPNQPLGGQTFASTLLLSFSCAPLLKQHLLRNLNMTNEELASLEPIIAQAWDHWDQQRRLGYPHHPSGPKPPDGPNEAPPYPHPAMPTEHHPFIHDPATASASQNEFRSRFRSSMNVPPPFQDQRQQQPIAAPPPPPPPTVSPPSVTTTVEPRLTTKTPVPPVPVPVMDPQLGQARDEAAGVAGKLENS